MAEPLHLLFHQTPEQMRHVGARGGRASARNRRARLREAAALQPVVAPMQLPPETAREAIAALDAQFPWLCGAEKRLSSRRDEQKKL